MDERELNYGRRVLEDVIRTIRTIRESGDAELIVRVAKELLRGGIAGPLPHEPIPEAFMEAVVAYQEGGES